MKTSKTTKSDLTKNGQSKKSFETKPEMVATSSAKQAKTATTKGIVKEYGKDNKCTVTFTFPAVAAPKAKIVAIAGEFNNWDMRKNVMKKNTNGDYTIQLKLDKGKNYQFKYVVDEQKWENDWAADGYVDALGGSTKNSLVSV